MLLPISGQAQKLLFIRQADYLVMVDLLVLFCLFLGVSSGSSRVISSSSSTSSRSLFTATTLALWVLTANPSTSAAVTTMNTYININIT